MATDRPPAVPPAGGSNERKGWGWIVPAVVAAALTFITLAIGIWELVRSRDIEAASWVMAAGGLGLVAFSSVQLHRESQRENRRQAAEARHKTERLAAARAKLKPAAWLARRMCRQAVSDSNGTALNRWLARWYTPPRLRGGYLDEGGAAPDPINVLEERMRETVTLAAEAGGDDVRAADAAFEAFIAAANIINDMAKTLLGPFDTSLLQAAIPRARKAVNYLATASRELESLAPPGEEEPCVSPDPKFPGER